MYKILVASLLVSLLSAGSVSAVGPAQAGLILILSFVGILIFWFFIFFFLLVGVLLWIWMFVDCLVRENFRGNDRMVWIIILLLTSIFGAVAYYFIVRRRLGSGKVRKRTANRVHRSR